MRERPCRRAWLPEGKLSVRQWERLFELWESRIDMNRFVERPLSIRFDHVDAGVWPLHPCVRRQQERCCID